MTIDSANEAFIRRWMVLPRSDTANPWCYYLRREAEEFLAVEEFHVVYIIAGDSVVVETKRLGVDLMRWERIQKELAQQDSLGDTQQREIAEQLAHWIRRKAGKQPD